MGFEPHAYLRHDVFPKIYINNSLVNAFLVLTLSDETVIVSRPLHEDSDIIFFEKEDLLIYLSQIVLNSVFDS